ncbi:MAG: class I SAM-dependent methyltransferase [Gammaproteobacteria bacterium]|nr:class I SAM-dependent methyltransferase [Gammaproteobacteria bacterium]
MHTHLPTSPQPPALLAPAGRRGVSAQISLADAHRILETLLEGYTGPVAVSLWDDSYVQGSSDAAATLSFRQPGALRELILHPDLVRMAESYLLGAIEVYGRMDIAFDLVDFLERHDIGRLERARLLVRALRLPNLDARRSLLHRAARASTHANGIESIAHHYDVSNAFYGLWLDPELIYSCAYFRSAGQTLAEAQRDKLDYLCRKLRLQPGQQLLDIGCGWGALALWAARHYGARVHGITLSERQCQYAQARVREAGLDDRVRIELRDYRDLPQTARYDRVVSVGMFEHVGLDNLPHYFETVQRVLAPGGLFLNHGITNDRGWKDGVSQRFVNQYVFPDGELTRVSAVQESMEQAGFEILDVESLRPHYALTLRHWLQRFEAEYDRIVSEVGSRLYRTWRLYLGGSAHYFRQGSLGVYQILAGHYYADQPLPLRRDDLYRDG